MSIVTRFPPSPTGLMHIGNARTALFNWLYARRHGGQFLFRIEDTDRKRHSEEAVEAIIRGLQWLELDWDGEIVSQFARMNRHAEIARQMVEAGAAYYCYCTPEELEAMRAEAIAQKRPVFYDRRWRDAGGKAIPPGVKPTIRIKAPMEGHTTIQDRVQGEVTIHNEQLDDFIILRSDGTPTYMLSVVVDDHDMGITHIIRGDDHLNNAFRQQVIFQAMKWTVPVFAHVPLIHGPDGSKFSKRHGAQSVEEYKMLGYLPEAMRNYLMRLGWAHGDEEIIDTARALEIFDLEGIGRSPARFDFAKLENINAHYMKQAAPARIMAQAAPIYAERHHAQPQGIALAHIEKGIEELQSRAKTLVQFVDESMIYAKSRPLAYDEAAAQQLHEAGAPLLQGLLNALQALGEFTAAHVQECCKQIAQTHAQGKMGKVAMPLRAALTGTTISPTVFNVAEILGAEESLARLEDAIKFANKTV